MSSVSKISLLVLHVPFVSQVTVASQVTVVKMPCGIPISFRRKKGKRHLQQQQSKSSRSRSPSPEPAPAPSSDTFRPIPRTPPPTRVGPPPSPPVPTHPVAPVAPEPSGPQTLQPCSICNRTFLPQSLSKHEKICEKMTVKKRKTFDSSRQRREGTDLEQYLPKNFGLPENSPFLEKSPPNTAKATPKPKPQSVRTAITKPTSELQKCPHCSRAFGPRAFERHVEWCGDKAKILPGAGAQPPRLQDAKQRLNARTQYKAPPVRGRRSSQTRDKSSNSRSASVESSRGVSPPLPREYGDYRTSRTRASESQSSGEQCEPAHVPLLRPARHSLRSSGDAVRARQARLARDLSSSRKPQESKPSSAKLSVTDLNLKKSSTQNKLRLNVKKKQQLQKLEELANKYKEKATKEIVDVSSKRTEDKSQIPIVKKKDTIKSKINQEKVVCENDTISELKNDIDLSKQAKSKVHKAPKAQEHGKSTQNTNAKEKFVKPKARKNAVKLVKENSMSLDSLEDAASKKGDKNCQSIGINTELLCPSIPCIIYENPEMKKSNKNRKSKSKDNNIVTKVTNAPEPKVELLYKNLTVVSSCDIQAKSESMNDSHCKEDNTTGSTDYNTTFSTSDHLISDFTDSTSNISKGKQLSSDIGGQKPFSDESLKKDIVEDQPYVSEQKFCDESPSVENLELNYDVSAETFDYSAEHNGDSECVDDSFSRHGSGETYTKFTENAEDLEEFLNLTDKMISDKNDNENFELDKELDNICTPKTNSIEAINSLENITTTENPEKRVFSDTFEELKNNLKELLKGAKAESAKSDIAVNNTDEPNKKVCDMEHITVYGLKLYDKVEKEPSEKFIPENEVPQISEKYVLEREVPQFKLPSISENNKLENKIKCNKKRMQRIYKPNRKLENSKMVGEQSRANTFIKNEQEDNSDDQSITSEAPPLKLPRIENKSSNNVSESIFPSSVKRSTSLLDSIQKKNSQKQDSAKSRKKADQLEQDLMQSLKDFDKFYESERHENKSSKDMVNYNTPSHNGTTKRDSRVKMDRINRKDNVSNGNYTPNGKVSNDSAYSRLVSLNRISPSKLSLCNSKEPNGLTSLEQIPAGSESGSGSSEEFLAMERSAELDDHAPYKEDTHAEKRVSSRASSRRSPEAWRRSGQLSSSGSETSLQRDRDRVSRLSRFCHECGNKFPVDSAKFCIQCGVKRLRV
ncbi:protein piccolo-like isoform X3 [Plodia interpunctella]|uniref:protein piccolo-like isoform X3 n=1 Tax=Plodia interpunctella TaxID=58824 RepID=UPI002367F978|nr:protein piccolo-like isoform X3 [Plodia interpunctella]